MAKTLLEIVGLGCLVVAAWVTNAQLGLAALGLVALNWAYSTKTRGPDEPA